MTANNCQGTISREFYILTLNPIADKLVLMKDPHPEGAPFAYSTYVNYSDMDPFKVACQQAAISTGSNIERFLDQGLDVGEVTFSRGESAFSVDVKVLRPVRFRESIVLEGI